MKRNQAICRSCGKPIDRYGDRCRLSFSSATHRHVRDKYRPNGWSIKRRITTILAATYCPTCSSRIEAVLRKELGL